MRRMAILLLLTPALLFSQVANLDEGRLDPTWFGGPATFQPSKDLGFQWLKPGLDLTKRSLQLRTWEPTAWLLGRREVKDQLLVLRMEPILMKELERRLRRGVKAALPVSMTQGDVFIQGRVVDAVGEADDGRISRSSFSFDLKLVDADSGELLAAFHTTIEGPGQDSIAAQYGQWCEDLGRFLVSKSAPVEVKPVSVAPVPQRFDLEGALRRIEGLKRDGLLSDEEYQALRKKAAEKGK